MRLIHWTGGTGVDVEMDWACLERDMNEAKRHNAKKGWERDRDGDGPMFVTGVGGEQDSGLIPW